MGTLKKNFLLIGGALFYFLCVGGIQNALAELLPIFDIHEYTDRAELIAVGALDKNGFLKIERVIKGVKKENPIELSQGASIYAQFQRLQEFQGVGSIQIIAFLEEGYRPINGLTGVVGIAGEHVFLCHGKNRQGVLEKHPSLIFKSFVEATQRAGSLSKECQRLIDAAPSAERAKHVLKFLLRQTQSLEYDAFFERTANYHFRKIARGLYPIDPKEEQAFLDALEKSIDTREQLMILDLAQSIPFTAGAYDQVRGFIENRYPADVRRSAIYALVTIDRSRVVDSFASFLDLDEPELQFFLNGIDPLQEQYLSSQALDLLLRLAQDMRKAHVEQGQQAFENESYALINQMARYAHPRLTPFLYEWAMTNDHSSSDQALSSLQDLTGLSYSRENKDLWEAWWKEAQPLLKQSYNLQEEEGRWSWYEAWYIADAATRNILMRLWFFEKDIDEEILIQDTANANDHYSQAAKSVLSVLWQRKQISPRGRKEIVSRYLNPKLVEIPSSMKERHELQIITDRTFPFPKDSWIEIRTGWDAGHNTIDLSDSWGALSLCNDNEVVLGSFSGPTEGGTAVKSLLEIREVEHGNGGKVLWLQSWSLGPIQLQ